MKAFGDKQKNRSSPFDHQPADVDPDASHVRQQYLEHLGNAAAGGRRADTDDGRTGEGTPDTFPRHRATTPLVRQVPPRSDVGRRRLEMSLPAWSTPSVTADRDGRPTSSPRACPASAMTGQSRWSCPRGTVGGTSGPSTDARRARRWIRPGGWHDCDADAESSGTDDSYRTDPPRRRRRWPAVTVLTTGAVFVLDRAALAKSTRSRSSSSSRRTSTRTHATKATFTLSRPGDRRSAPSNRTISEPRRRPSRRGAAGGERG